MEARRTLSRCSSGGRGDARSLADCGIEAELGEGTTMVGEVYALGLGYAPGYTLALPFRGLMAVAPRKVELVPAPCIADLERGLEDEENIWKPWET